MAFITNFDASNRADFIADISATDADTGADIDFTGATVTIAIWEEGCSPKITATIGSGITQPSATVLELTVTAIQMAVFKPGSYLIGGIYAVGGTTTQLFIGDFVVYQGKSP